MMTMIKAASFLLVLSATGLVVAQDDDDCVSVWELSAGGDYGGYAFAGVENMDGFMGLFDTPMYATLEDAQSNQDNPAGRVQGEFFTDELGVSTGNWAFGFFDEDDWLIGRIGFGNEAGADYVPNTATGGSGRWVDFVGTISNTIVSESPDFIIEWTMCYQEPVTVEPGTCETIYELSTNGTIDGSLFAGSVMDDATGIAIFDTPLYTENPAILTDTSVVGVLLGQHFPAGNASIGNWAFNLGFDNDHIIAYTSFGPGVNGQNDEWLPKIITGGSGVFAGWQGNLTNTVISEDPFVISWETCAIMDYYDNNMMMDNCTTFYELSTAGSDFGPDGLVFAGANDLGQFQTPFYWTFEEAVAAGDDPSAVEVAGAVQGQHYPHANGTFFSGDWTFTWAGGEDSLVGRFGFSDDVIAPTTTPNVVLGGSGVWGGFQGTLESLVVEEDPYFIIEWTVCPAAAATADGDGEGGDEGLPVEESEDELLVERTGNEFD